MSLHAPWIQAGLRLFVSCLQGGSAYAGHADDDKSAHTNGANVGGGNYATKVLLVSSHHLDGACGAWQCWRSLVARWEPAPLTSLLHPLKHAAGPGINNINEQMCCRSAICPALCILCEQPAHQYSECSMLLVQSEFESLRSEIAALKKGAAV